MKKRFAFTLKLVSMLSAIFMLPSCENFFSGATARKDIEDAINFANAPTFDLKIFSESSETIPSGNLVKKVGEKFSTICKPFNDYEFIKWQVLHQDSNGKWIPYTSDEADEIIEIENRYERETSFSLKKEVSGLLIQPYCVSRPQILSTFPYYEKTGILRDSRITIMFDRDICENSIYYDSEELRKELKSAGIVPEDYTVVFHKKDPELSDAEKVTAEELNSTGIFDKLYIFYDAAEPESIDSIAPENRVYGYIACFDNDDGEKIYKTFYKNLQVTDRNKQNMLSHYRAPYFERDDILVVPAESGTLTPAASSQILTTIGMGIYTKYTEDGFEKPITLAANKKFNYYLNSQTDTTNPDVEFTLTDSSGTALKPSCSIDFQQLSYDSIQNYSHLGDKKIKLYIKASDLESGMLDYFQISLRKISSEKYDAIINALFYNQKKTVSIDFTSMIESSKLYGTETEPMTIDLARLFPTIIDGQGLYELEISVKDINGNDYNNFTITGISTLEQEATRLKRYVIIDNEGPAIAAPTLKSSKPGELEVSFKPTADFNYAWIYYRQTGTSSWTGVKLTKSSSVSNFAYFTETKKITLDKGKKYDVQVNYYDIYGYRTVSSIVSEYTRPDCIRITSLTPNSSSPTTKLDLCWEYPSTFPTSGNGAGIMIFYTSDCNNIQYATYDDWWNVGHTFNGSQRKYANVLHSGNLVPGTCYYVYAVSYVGNMPQASTVTSGKSTNTYYDENYDDYMETNSIKYCYTKPNPVTNLQASTTGTTSVSLSWTNPTSGNKNGYGIYKKDLTNGSSTWTLCSYVVGATTSAYNATGLTAGHKYSFCVRSYVKDSVKNDGTKIESADTTVTATTRPNAPTNVRVSNPSTNNLTVSWTRPSGNYDGVVLLYSTSDSISGATLGQSSTSTFESVSASDTLVAGTKYYIWAVSYIGSKPTSVSQIINNPMTVNYGTSISYYTRPVAKVSASYFTYTKDTPYISFSWRCPSGNYTDFRIYKKQSGGSYVLMGSYGKSTSSSLSYAGFTAGSSWQFKIVTACRLDDDTYVEAESWPMVSVTF